MEQSDALAAAREAYNQSHGETRDFALLPFYPFLAQGHVGAFDGYRSWAAAMVAGVPGAAPIPFSVSNLVFLHLYITKGYREGIQHEVELLRNAGITKAQIWETIAFAFVHAGPSGLNASAESLSGYMERWIEPAPAEAWPFPATWRGATGPSPYAGLDFSRPELDDLELDALRQWHLAMHGEVPAFVDFFGRHHPRALKAFRQRYETARGGALPAQMFPLFALGHAAFMGRVGAVRRAMHEASVVGVTRSEVIFILAVLQVYLGDSGFDGVLETVEGMLGTLSET